MDESEFYAGRCTIGGELLCPKEKMRYPEGMAPYVVCPLHGCTVWLGVIPKEEHDSIWLAFEKAPNN